MSQIIQIIADTPGLRVASVAEDSALHSAHEYIEFLARQRNTAYRAFTSEKAALKWLREER
ncbi:MAG: hypothetical protein ACREH3_20070, partial [Geminicoccales bacterium]